MVRATRGYLIVLGGIVAAACSGGSTRESVPYTATAALGAYEDGSGRLGLAVLTTIRSDTGAGPESDWLLELGRDGAALGRPAAYAAGAGYAVSLWPDVAPVEGAAFQIVASSGGQTLATAATLADAIPLAVPGAALSLDGTRLEWGDVAGAEAYACVLTANGAIQEQQVSAAAGCDVSALPDGSYLASIQALGADPTALAPGVAPAMPRSFRVSQARLGLLLRASGAPLVLRAAGGRIDYGLVPGLAIWVGLSAPDEAPDGGVWSITVTGPDLPESDPLRFELPVNFTKRLVWAYGLPPTPGLYTLVASDGVESITTQFAIAPPLPLPLPEGVSASGDVKGGAHVTWARVPGAQSYFASVWLGSSYVAGQWVTGTSADFLAGTFTSGLTYEVYVAAADFDVTAGPPPTRVSASENSYTPARFAAP
ncbi:MULTISPECIES: hypothetical protein [Anaeromyxobacter]|uniref:hypothetical protein n=1 Tax=Anaeromyxobacter TaxID=161492 RepID=UPI001F577CFA|nr:MULTISPECIES: hypothetical protein [unclassified Anaeromyxobacter]